MIPPLLGESSDSSNGMLYIYKTLVEGRGHTISIPNTSLVESQLPIHQVLGLEGAGYVGGAEVDEVI